GEKGPSMVSIREGCRDPRLGRVQFWGVTRGLGRLASSTPRDTGGLVACAKMIEAPHTASRHCEIEEHEAVDDSQLTPVQERKEAPRRVRYEVCDGHVACEDE